MIKTNRVLFAALALVPAAALANTFTGSAVDGGYNLSASASFVTSGNLLTIVLTNTATAKADSPAHTLSGLFWNVNGNPTITKNSVSLGSSTLINPPASYTLGKEYAFKSGITAGPSLNVTNAYGVSSVGIGIFGGADQFTAGGSGVDGDGFNIIPTAGITNQPKLQSLPLVKNSVTFVLNVPDNFNVNDIKDVKFHFGSDIGLPTVQAVPEPASLSVLALGGLGLLRRRNRK